jgi:hypothetical protein
MENCLLLIRLQRSSQIGLCQNLLLKSISGCIALQVNAILYATSRGILERSSSTAVSKSIPTLSSHGGDRTRATIANSDRHPSFLPSDARVAGRRRSSASPTGGRSPRSMNSCLGTTRPERHRLGACDSEALSRDAVGSASYFPKAGCGVASSEWLISVLLPRGCNRDRLWRKCPSDK